MGLKTNATLWASRMRGINGYARSDRNPADAAGRDKRRWAGDKASAEESRLSAPASVSGCPTAAEAAGAVMGKRAQPRPALPAAEPAAQYLARPWLPIPCCVRMLSTSGK